ncbi:MAG: dTDP-glucose 4,6-dehydratase [Acidobacteria bacterium 13_1_20CM_3_53_8]|nr:MAG: dTDP-glucose 4,6-dehydratase [Acidobacteria bacterium 13_1_20CM_3_53_8]
MKTYVILGGNGVFGVHAAFYLLEHADPKKVICVGRNPEKPEAFTLNVGRGDPRYVYHQIHVVYEQDRLFEMFDAERPEVIINFAAQGEGAASWSKFWRFYETNSVALAKMTEELLHRDYLERWIQIGTSELYGSCDFPAKEETPIQPTSPYAASKAAGDMHLLSISNVLKFPMNIIRPSNAYAPGQLLHRVIPKAVLCGLTRQKLPLHGGGRARKSYIHARDLGRAIHLVSEKAPLGKVYNAGPPAPISIRDLVAKVAEAMNMPFEQLCEVTEDRLGQDSQYWLDSSAIKRDVGWEPQISLEEGIEEMVEWGKKYLDYLRTVSTGYVLRA